MRDCSTDLMIAASVATVLFEQVERALTRQMDIRRISIRPLIVEPMSRVLIHIDRDVRMRRLDRCLAVAGGDVRVLCSEVADDRARALQGGRGGDTSASPLYWAALATFAVDGAR